MLEVLLLLAVVTLAAVARSQHGRLRRVEDELRKLRGIRQPGDAGVASNGGAEASPPPPEGAAGPPQPSPPGPWDRPVAVAPMAPAPAPRSVGSLLSPLLARWPTVVGGLALVLGGAFLVQVSIEAGLLTPELRILMAMLLAAGLAGGAEWIRSTGRDRRTAAALAGASASIAYSAVLAAFHLHGMISPMLAVVGMAGVSAGTIGLGLRHGPAIAGIGLVGAYAAPLLVGSEAPRLPLLFGYLSTVTMVTALLARWRGWDWAGFVASALGALWLVLYLLAETTPAQGSDLAAIAIHAIVLGVATIIARPTVGTFGSGSLLATAVGGAAAGLAISAPTTEAALTTGLLAFGLAGVFLSHERRAPGLPGHAAAAVVLFAGHLALLGQDFHPAIHLLHAALSGLVLVRSGMEVAARDGRMRWWTAAGPTALLLMSATGDLSAEDIAIGSWASGITIWGLASGALALALFTLARREAGRQGRPGVATFTAVGALAAASLAIVQIVDGPWLGPGLAALALAGAFDARRLKAPHFDGALVVLAALLGSWSLAVMGSWLADGRQPGPAAPAVAAALVAVGRVWLGGRVREAYDASAVMAGIAAGVVVSHLLADAAGLPVDGRAFLQVALLATMALGAAALLARLGGHGFVIAWAARMFLGIGCLLVWLGPMTSANPALFAIPVGETPFANSLLPALLLPTLIALALLRRLELPVPARHAVLGSAVIWGAGWVALATVQSFQGGVILMDALRPVELFAWSAGWLLYGGLWLAVGIRHEARSALVVSQAIVLTATAKVFLVDLAFLEGLWRAGAFLGLGGSLIATGLLYRRVLSQRTGAPSRPR